MSPGRQTSIAGIFHKWSSFRELSSPISSSVFIFRISALSRMCSSLWVAWFADVVAVPVGYTAEYSMRSTVRFIADYRVSDMNNNDCTNESWKPGRTVVCTTRQRRKKNGKDVCLEACAHVRRILLVGNLIHVFELRKTPPLSDSEIEALSQKCACVYCKCGCKCPHTVCVLLPLEKSLDFISVWSILVGETS